LKYYSSLEDFHYKGHAVVTIGTFDGVHAGHRKIIQRLKEIASEKGGETVVLTFYPHPRLVLQPDDNDLKMITTLEERSKLLEEYGIDHLIIREFDTGFSRIGAIEFVRDILVKQIGMKTLVIGHDHHFGRNREGSYRTLEELAPIYDFGLEEIPEQVINEMAVSSTKIRKALLSGQIAEANELMGHDFVLSGSVVTGDKMGRQLGFPTANIDIGDPYKLIPADGIYAVQADCAGKRLKGMLYIGHRPALKGIDRRIEVNLFDFEGDLYSQPITVYLKARIRGDQNFDDLAQLQLKMEEDRLHATKLLS
jgi:riboflavin kinase / FMN adenylyltransferase